MLCCVCAHYYISGHVFKISVAPVSPSQWNLAISPAATYAFAVHEAAANVAARLGDCSDCSGSPFTLFRASGIEVGSVIQNNAFVVQEAAAFKF